MDIKKYFHIHSKKDFDNLDVFVLFEDIETKKIIYKNKSYIREVERFKDHKPNFDNRFITIDSFIGEVDGKKVVIEIGERIVPVTSSDNNLELRTTITDIESLKREEIQNDFLNHEHGRSNHERIIDSIVKKIITFYDSSYAHLFIFGKKKTNPGTLYQYQLGSNRIVKPKTVYLPSYWDNALTNFFETGFSLLCENTVGFGTFDQKLSDEFIEKKIENVIMIPFFAESKLVGLLMLSNPKKVGDRPDLFLADYASDSIGTLIHRGKLYNDIYFDPITGLPWASVIDSIYDSFIRRQKDLPVIIMEFDIMHFRAINRSYGTLMADEILCKIADKLRNRFPNSIIARKNDSDKFIVITTGIAENFSLEAANIVDEIRKEFSSIMLYFAFGIYQVKDKREPLNIAMLKTSFAHTIAKEDKLSKIKIYDEELDKKELQYQYYTNNFHSSLKEEKFEIYIQPRYNLQRHTFYGGEALVRWNLDDKLVPPGDFINLFETNGLICELDLYVLEKVCKTIAKWIKESPQNLVPISVNFSRVDFGDELLFEKMIYIINSYNIPTKYIEIEITESAYVDYESQIIVFMEKCRQAGIRILMDDFGSGVSSFNSLKNLNIDVLKLDYKFLSAGGDNKKKRKIIQSIVSLARDIDVAVVVEGIERKEEAAFFNGLGIRYVQGYFFGKPMPIPEFEKILNKEAEFAEEIVTDTRFILNDILDNKSNVNLLINKSILYMGLFRFDGQELYPMYLNETAKRMLSTSGHLKDFMTYGLLAFVDSYVKEKSIECLKNNHQLYSATDIKRITFKFGLQSYVFDLCSLFIREDKDYKYFIVQAKPVVTKNLNNNTSLDYEKEIKWLLSNEVFGCIILDSYNYIVDFNKTAKDIYPEIKKKQNIKDVINIEFKNTVEKYRVFSEAKQYVYELDIKDVTLGDKQNKIITLSSLGTPNKYITEFAVGGFKFYDRALSTIEKIAAYYTEIDLSNDTFLQICYKKNEIFNDNSLLKTGRYSTDYINNLVQYISIDDRKNFEEKMNLDALIEASKSMSPFSLTFKIFGQKIFFRINVKFYHDKGVYYACFYIEDITEMKSKDYDLLTGCMSRNGGIQFLNNYFAQHPLDKMAFIIIDLDKFKSLNDTYGHPLGDRVLNKMHKSFKKLPNEFGYSTRLGGDEFCLLLKKRDDNFDKDKVREQIDDVIKPIGKEIGLDIETHCSCGFALFPEEGRNIDTLYSAADKDLYIHKKPKKKIDD